MNKHEFWVTNINFKKDIRIHDLGVQIRGGKSVNLLDKKHYNITEEQIKQSMESGSLKRRAKFIKIREVRPKIMPKPGLHLSSDLIKKQPRSIVKIEEKHFDEFNINEAAADDIRFAKDDADLAITDNIPGLAVDEKLKHDGVKDIDE